MKLHLDEDSGVIGEQVRRLLRISDARTAADMGDSCSFRKMERIFADVV